MADYSRLSLAALGEGIAATEHAIQIGNETMQAAGRFGDNCPKALALMADAMPTLIRSLELDLEQLKKAKAAKPPKS